MTPSHEDSKIAKTYATKLLDAYVDADSEFAEMEAFERISLELIAETRKQTLEEAARNLWHGPNVQPCPVIKCARLTDREYACAELRRMAESLSSPASTNSIHATASDDARKGE